MLNPARIIIISAFILIALIWSIVGFFRIEAGAAWLGTPTLSRTVYVLVALAACLGAIFVARGDRINVPGRMGSSTGDNRGPEPGDGAVIHHSSGEADFDGGAGNIPTPVKDSQGDLPDPSRKAAD